MKKRSLIALALAAAIAFNAGCCGSFSLTKKVYKANGSQGSKWVNSLLFWIPGVIVYPIAIFVDVVVLNFIEFYTGKNPLALSNPTPTHQMVQSKGKLYDVAIGNNRITITETKGPDAGKTIAILYNQKSLSWSLVGGGKETAIASYSPKPLDRFDLYYPDGSVSSRQIALAR